MHQPCQIAFFMTHAWHMQFTACQVTPACHKEDLLQCVIKNVHRIHASQTFKITAMFEDPEFECPRTESLSLGTALNVARAKESAPEIECRVRVVEECARSCINVDHSKHCQAAFDSHLHSNSQSDPSTMEQARKSCNLEKPFCEKLKG